MNIGKVWHNAGIINENLKWYRNKQFHIWVYDQCKFHRKKFGELIPHLQKCIWSNPQTNSTLQIQPQFDILHPSVHKFLNHFIAYWKIMHLLEKISPKLNCPGALQSISYQDKLILFSKAPLRLYLSLPVSLSFTF